jgi:hypothetical protein
MKFERAKSLEFLNRRLELVRELIRAGAEWRRSFIAMRLDQSERSLSEEVRLAGQIYALDQEIAKMDGLYEVADLEICEALERTTVLNRDLMHSNEIRKSILKRSKITINALRNLYNSHSATYAAPAAHSKGTLYEETV